MKSKRGGGNMNNNNNMNLGSNNNNNLNNSDGGDHNMIIIIVIALIILGVLVYFGYKYLNSYQASQSVTYIYSTYSRRKRTKRFTNGFKIYNRNEYNFLGICS